MSISDNREDSKCYAPPYEPLKAVRLPDPIPDIGMEAGTYGCIDRVYDGGKGIKMMLVDFSSADGPSALVGMEILPDSSLRIVGHSELGG